MPTLPRSPRLLAPEVGVLRALADQLADGEAQLFGRGPAHEVPAVEDPVDREVWEQREGERNGQGTVTPVGGFADAELIGEPELLIAQEVEVGTEPGLERGLDPGRVDRDGGDPAIGDFSRSVELDQFPQLNLSLRSPGAAVEGQHQGPTSRQLLDR